MCVAKPPADPRTDHGFALCERVVHLSRDFCHPQLHLRGLLLYSAPLSNYFFRAGLEGVGGGDGGSEPRCIASVS